VRLVAQYIQAASNLALRGRSGTPRTAKVASTMNIHKREELRTIINKIFSKSSPCHIWWAKGAFKHVSPYWSY
jgi:hypothetical protein